MYHHVIPLTTVGGTQVWDPLSASEEVTALIYNTFIPGPGFFGGVAGVSVMWEWQGGPGGGYVNIGDDGIVFKAPGVVDRVYLIDDNTPGAAPARFDIYVDPSSDHDAYQGGLGPLAWGPGVGLAADTFPTYSNGGLWLSGGFSPVVADFDVDLYRDPGEPNLAWWDVNGNGLFEPLLGDTWAVELVNSITPGRSGGYANAWLDATGGSFINMVNQDHLDLAGSPWDYDMFFQSTAYGPSDNWPNTSTDPVVFAVVPEPVSMVFFGTIMVGAVASALRKRSK
jgi:hypothetical protein